MVIVVAAAIAVAAILALAACSSSGGDAAITNRVRTVLQTDRVVDASKIQVTTERGVVTLAGSVPGEEGHRKAVVLATSVEGVRQVRDRLTVTPAAAPDAGEIPTPSQPAGGAASPRLGGLLVENRARHREPAPRSDDGFGLLAAVVGPQGDLSLQPAEGLESAAAPASRHEAAPAAPERLALAAAPEDGGEVPLALSLPGSVAALRGESPEDAAITARVRAALAEVSRGIQVLTRSGVVTLSGAVDTELEREQALRTARATEGVERVEDRIVLLQS
jgi:hyperosmotically inducible protein